MDSVGAVVIGGGAVGCATAWELARHGLRDLFVLERMPGVGEVQSGRNSGVVHAGIYYRSGSLKAALCASANARMYEFCRANGVPIAQVGKLVVARSSAELPALEALAAQAEANGVPGARHLSRAEVRAYEPNVDVPAALHVPTTGIVDAARYTRTLADLAEAEGASGDRLRGHGDRRRARELPGHRRARRARGDGDGRGRRQRCGPRVRSGRPHG